MPAFDGNNPHPLYVFLALLAFALVFGGFFALMLRNQKRKGYGQPTTEPPIARQERTSAPLRRETVATYSAAPAPVVRPAETPTAPPPLPFGTVWRYLGAAIHLLIVGETHSGKSTSARAVLHGRIQAGDRIIILDPHATPRTWGGIVAVGAGRDFAAIETAMGELLAEMTRRYERLAVDADYQPEPLSIFVDEWPAIQTACKKVASQFITELAQEGRKAGMRLVMLTQSDLVASLGIEGKSDVRENFTMLLLGSKAIARADVSGLTWPAALRKGEGKARAAITDPMPDYETLLNTNGARLWQVAAPRSLPMKQQTPVESTADSDPELDPLWQRFLNGESLLEPETITSDEPVIEKSQGQKNENPTLSPLTAAPVLRDTSVVFTGDETQSPAVTADLPMDDVSVAIRGMISAGLSRSKVIQLLGLPGQRVAQFKKIKEALGEETPQA
jgi:hypothetical protein